ncbi:MAG: hypothetical protein RL352_459, partial [Actinomycetota bacterium]
MDADMVDGEAAVDSELLVDGEV